VLAATLSDRIDFMLSFLQARGRGSSLSPETLTAVRLALRRSSRSAVEAVCHGQQARKRRRGKVVGGLDCI
jgi:hypothetical protein